MAAIQRFRSFARFLLLLLVSLIFTFLFSIIYVRGWQTNAYSGAYYLPDISFLGEGPGTFTTPLDNFIVKKGYLDFVFEPGPTYTAQTNERIWGVRGADGTPPPTWDATINLGPVEAGCIARYVGIDDDLDDRINCFELNGEPIEVVTDGMVFSGNFLIPEDGELIFVANDTVGGWFSSCDEQITPTPNNTTSIADFSALPTSGAPPLGVNFTNLSTGDFDQCLWDFGDGNSSDVCQDPSHIYEISGTFTPTLTVDGPGGNDMITIPDYIIVYEPVNAIFSALPTSGAPPLGVNFTNLSTGDFEQCLWNFGDGETLANCDDSKHVYKDEGNYSVNLTVKGLGGENKINIENCVKVAYYRFFLPGVLRASQ